MKVFISSTYKDLIDYRDAAIRAVEGTNYQASKMEVFGARPDEPLDACLKEVEESELFIGIYALRYGFIPDNEDISITEMEYVHAKKLGKLIYCFILDEENQPWFTKWTEKEPGESKLKDFKKRIQKDHVCDYFTTPDDLRAKVSNALSLYVSTHTHLPDSQHQTYLPPKPTGSTLPNQPYFFGRDKELAIIADAISPDSRTWGALIDGPGGIGKTALAIRAAHDTPQELFERKIFITAKVRELTAEGEAKLTDFTRPTYLAMLDELGKELGADGLEKLAPDERPNELRLALAGKKALIVFDNLETLPEDERVRLFQFLSRLPEVNKAIVTSRRRSDVDARIVRLDRLSHDEAMQLIKELAKKYPRLQRATTEEHEKLYAITQGNPLFIRWIAGQLGREGSQLRTIEEAVKFIDKAPKGNDPLEYIFGDLLETFTADETKVLAALTYFSLPAKTDWVIEITGLSEKSTEIALEDLTDRSVLISDSEIKTFFLPPLATQFIAKNRLEIVDAIGKELVIQSGEKADGIDMHYMRGGVSSSIDIFESEWPFIYAALPKILEGSHYQIQSLCDSLGRFLHITNRWDEAFTINQIAEKKAVEEDDYKIAGWRAYELGMLYAERMQIDKLLACADRAEKYWGEKNARHKAIVLEMKGRACYLSKDYQAAIVYIKKALEIHRNIDSYGTDIAAALNSLGLAEEFNNDFLSAERNYREAVEIKKAQKRPKGVEIYTSNLARLLLKLQKWEEAETLAKEAASDAEFARRYRLAADNYITLAKALAGQDRMSDGQFYLSEAIEIYSHLRQTKLLEYAQNLLTEYESKTHTVVLNTKHHVGKNYSHPASVDSYREILDSRRVMTSESLEIASMLNELAGAEKIDGDYESAEHDYREARRIAKILRNDKYLAIYTGNLAELYLDRQQWKEAESFSSESLTLAEKFDDNESVAHQCSRLAQALLKQNKDLNDALSLSRRAVEIYTRLRSPSLQSAQETFAEIEKKINRE